jgi:hypothetical protein
MDNGTRLAIGRDRVAGRFLLMCALAAGMNSTARESARGPVARPKSGLDGDHSPWIEALADGRDIKVLSLLSSVSQSAGDCPAANDAIAHARESFSHSRGGRSAASSTA